MAWSMPSEQLQLLIAGYILGDLDSNEALEFERLLAEDPAIAVEVARMQKTLEQSYAPPEVEPPAHLRSAILQQLESEQRPEVVKPTVAPVWTAPTAAPRRKFFWNLPLGIAAAALIAVLGFNNYRLWQIVQNSPPTSDVANTLTYRLQGPTPGAGSATVVVNPDTLEALLTVQNLPPAPPGQTYVLWTVVEPNAPVTTDDKSAILTEVLELDAQGNLSQTIW
jgi:anti-sigma-K factor RskA